MHVYYRTCPGRYLGEASVFIAIATILHVLTIKKMKDENGEEITIDPETATYTTGLARYVHLLRVLVGR